MARPKLEIPNYKLKRRGETWYIHWWADGRENRISTGTKNRREAEKSLVQAVTCANEPDIPRLPTVSQILDGYLAAKKDEVITHDSLVHASVAIKKFLGDLEPDHLSEKVGKAFITDRREAGFYVSPAHNRAKKIVSDGTIRREFVVLRAALHWTYKQRWITHIPYVPARSA